MSFFGKKQRNRSIERVLRHKRIQQYLKANRLRVSPPYSSTEWNYWHIYEGGQIKPITADELLERYLEWKREHRVSAAEEAAARNLYPMRQELWHEIERLKKILAAHGKEFVTNQGIPKTRLQRMEQKLGYQLDPDLAAFYSMADGSPTSEEWFAVGIQNPVPAGLLNLEDALQKWEMAVENEEGNREYWQHVEKLGNLTRDPKIASGIMFPAQWWHFAGRDNPTVMLDMRPSPSGKPGQIIVYYHDPDALICVADNFLDFFRKSNGFLEARWDKIFSDEAGNL